MIGAGAGSKSSPRKFAARTRIVTPALLLAIAHTTAANARTNRPFFEPTDLELEDPGWVGFDFQSGVIRGRDPWRIVVSDLEMNFGLLPNVELDLDATYAIEGSNESPLQQPHATPDALWPSAKIGIKDWHDDTGSTAWALGLQMGPKLPIARGSYGLGAEGLFLLGVTAFGSHFVLNAGVLNDPHPSANESRPFGVETGLDIHTPFNKNDTLAFIGEISGVHFFSSDPHQLATTAGVSGSPLSYLDLSLVGIAGWLNGSDRYGIMVGITPKLRWFGTSK